jgi:hypothetical protein
LPSFCSSARRTAPAGNTDKYEGMQEPITTELTDEGMSFTSADGHSLVRWSKILR